jgi:hypothetical protein
MLFNYSALIVFGDGQAGGSPCGKAAIHIADIAESHILQGFGSKC